MTTSDAVDTHDTSLCPTTISEGVDRQEGSFSASMAEPCRTDKDCLHVICLPENDYTRDCKYSQCSCKRGQLQDKLSRVLGKLGIMHKSIRTGKRGTSGKPRLSGLVKRGTSGKPRLSGLVKRGTSEKPHLSGLVSTDHTHMLPGTRI
ncbi:hypothetical protein DPMN_014565 [Dreissena polymorpha]|uniref:Uncharacterized protein n=1 Tax=Dreissena polymorpha TaxID=45954 RepID=A0A9D4N9L0_DREPO|nr:hypothetical protein DPMN_014565 [Dreissena polymorpha]